jgi:flagellar protein FlaG
VSAESITTALFLISAVIGAGVLINAIFPVIYKTTSSVETVSAQSETRLKTDIAIVATLANHDELISGGYSKVWMKNTGSQRIHENEILNKKSTVIFGLLGDVDMMESQGTNSIADDGYGQWNYSIIEPIGNSYWDPGETLMIYIKNPTDITLKENSPMYFQFILPSGIKRSQEFTAY